MGKALRALHSWPQGSKLASMAGCAGESPNRITRWIRPTGSSPSRSF